jgi:hypothetical protein
MNSLTILHAKMQRSKDAQKQLIESLDREYHQLYSSWCSLIDACGDRNPYARDSRSNLPSVGLGVLRSVAIVEQTCGGITSNLWDDPFEWTLPETLTTPQRILEHLAEVEALRRKAFASLADDADLRKQISAPSGELVTLADLLVQTLARASQFYGQALLAAKITFHSE